MRETRFKNTEMGLIPEDWEKIEIGDIATLIQTGPFGSQLHQSDYSVVGIPVVMPKDIINGWISDESIARVTKDHIERLKRHKVKKGDFLFARRGDVGRCACVSDKEVGWLCGTGCFRVSIDKKKCDILFIYYQLQKKETVEWIVSKAIGSTMLNLNTSILSHIPIAKPQFKDEQSRIATALSDVDELIKNLKKLIEKKRNIKQGAMQELLSGKRRLPGFKEKWVEKEVGLTGLTYNGLSGKSKEDFGLGNSLYITFLNVLSNPVIDTSCFEKINIKPNERQNRALKGDIFFNTSSETPEEVGFCSYLDENIDNLYLNSFCFGFRISDPEIDGHFISYFWRSRKGRDIMTMLAQGSTRFNLSKALFKASCITIPSTKEEQQSIAKVLSDMDSEIQSLEARLAKYQSLKQGMMQQLLTGKIRLI